MIYKPSSPVPVSTTIQQVIENLELRDGMTVVELGCGKAEITIDLARQFPNVSFRATDVDSLQIARLQGRDDLPGNMTIDLGGAEQVPLPDRSCQRVMMLKSLHHVPTSSMPTALNEVHRILQPNGLALIQEPVYGGPFNDLLKRFHDEKRVRFEAFETIRNQLASGQFELVRQRFFSVIRRFDSFEQFEGEVMRVSHSDFGIDAAKREQVRQAYQQVADPTGLALLDAPQRIDLLKRSQVGGVL